MSGQTREIPCCFLSQSCDSYPIVEKYARGVLQCVENVRDKEKASDLKTLAASLAVKLRASSKTWVRQEKDTKEAPKATPKMAPKPQPKEGSRDPAKEATKEVGKEDRPTPPAKELPKEIKEAKPKPKEGQSGQKPKEANQKDQKEELKRLGECGGIALEFIGNSVRFQ